LTFEVIWEPAAVDLATRFLADDREGLRGLFEAIDALADEPRPAIASGLGTSGLYRLRVDRYRAVYEVDQAARTVKVRHIGRRG
jgi:mRNA interferase RelE/StbE